MAGNPLQAFTIRVLIVVAIGIAVAVLWAVSDVLVLAFGGVVMAAALRALSDPLARRSPLSSGAALLVVVLAVVAVLAGIGVLVGQRLTEQVGELLKTLPEALAKARAWAEASPMGRILLDIASQLGTGRQSFAGVAGVATSTFGVMANILVILFLGIYLAVDPNLYRQGALRLMPRSVRQRADAAIEAAGWALRNWLRGQLVSMLVIGAVTGVGLWLLGTPLALSMGLFAGLMEFISFIGPILSAIPAILISFSQGPEAALWVTVFYLAVHQIEGNILMPIVQRWAVSLPPALALAAVVVFGLLFGPFGVLFATPLMVVATVLIQKLYVEPVIEESPRPHAGSKDTGDKGIR